LLFFPKSDECPVKLLSQFWAQQNVFICSFILTNPALSTSVFSKNIISVLYPKIFSSLCFQKHKKENFVLLIMTVICNTLRGTEISGHCCGKITSKIIFKTKVENTLLKNGHMTLLHTQNIPFIQNICCKLLQLAKKRKFGIVTRATAHYIQTLSVNSQRTIQNSPLWLVLIRLMWYFISSVRIRIHGTHSIIFISSEAVVKFC
jgi:hypothetical protein